MKWALVTNFGNPGDEFARIGVEKLIQSVDSKASFICIRRDAGIEIGYNFPADRIVVCSMPGVWSHFDKEGNENSTRTHHSWEHYNRWSKEGRPVIFAGIGTCFGYDKFPGTFKIANRESFVADLKRLKDQCAGFYARTPLVGKLIGGCESSPCPSIFAAYFHESAPGEKQKLCNIMLGGAHYGSLKMDQAEIWMKNQKSFSDLLRSRGFRLVAHGWEELDNARALGWPDESIEFCFFSTPSLLDVYSRASVYVGNRVHGAIVSRAFGAKTLCIGYDSRLEAARLAGAEVCLPESVTEEKLESFLQAPTPELLPICKLFQQQREFFK